MHAQSRFYDLPKLNSSSGWTVWRKKATVLFKRCNLVLGPAPEPGLMVPAEPVWKEAWIRSRTEEILASRPTAAATASSESTPPPRVTFGGDSSSSQSSSASATMLAAPTPEEIGLPPDERPETTQEFLQRKVKYEKMNGEIYSDLIIACGGEALGLIMDAADGDGWGAYSRLEKEYGNASANSQFMVVKALIDLKQKGSIREHINQFKQLLRRLSDMKITMADSVVSVMFLRSLTEQYKQFATNAMMNGNMQSEALYTAASEYSKAHLAASDEAKTNSLAMRACQCPHGSGCARWRNNECDKFHPAPESRGTKRKQQKEKGKKSKGENWQCSGCQFYNYAERSECLKCKARKPKGNLQRSNKWYQAKLAEISEKHYQQSQEGTKRRSLGWEDTLSDDGEPIENADVAHDVDLPESALAAGERKKRMRFTVDSGASSHFVNSGVPLRDTRAQESKVQTAGGKLYPITEAGACSGTARNGNTVTFDAKRCKAFSHNLFSVYQAASNGTRTVFDWDESYLEDTATGKRIPLERREGGWTLTLEKPSKPSA